MFWKIFAVLNALLFLVSLTRHSVADFASDLSFVVGTALWATSAFLLICYAFGFEVLNPRALKQLRLAFSAALAIPVLQTVANMVPLYRNAPSIEFVAGLVTISGLLTIMIALNWLGVWRYCGERVQRISRKA